MNALEKLLCSLGRINKCRDCTEKASVRVEWGESTDDIDWYCSECFKDRYMCYKHRERTLETNYLKPNMCVYCNN